MDQNPLLDEQQIDGYWFLPDSPARSVFGTLTFFKDGFDLRVKDQLLPPPTLEPGVGYPLTWDRTTLPAVWGRSEDGKTDITLLAVSGRSWRVPSQMGRFPELWTPEAALLGAHVGPDVLIDRLMFRTENLDPWAGTPALHVEPYRDADGEAMLCTVTARRAVLAEADLVDVGHVAVVAMPRGPTIGAHGLEATLGVQAWFQVQLSPHLAWREAFRVASHLRDLIRLTTGEPCALSEVQLRTASPNDASSTAKFLIRTVALIRGPATPLAEYFMFSPLTALPGGFAAELAQCRRLRTHYRKAWQLLTANDDARVIDTADQFVTYHRAVEALHAADRDTFGPVASEAADSEHEQRVQRTMAAVPEDLTEWAAEALSATKPPEARHRLLDMLRSIGELGQKFAGGDCDQFAAEITSTRNALVHPHHRTGRNILGSDEEIFYYGQALHWLAVSYLLHQVGFDDHAIAAGMQRHPRASSVIEQMAELSSARRC